MKRSIRYATVILLAGLAQFSVPGDASAQNTPWKFSTGTKDPLTDETSGAVVSAHVDGGLIGFGCTKQNSVGDSIARLLVVASTNDSDRYSNGDVEVAWRTDNGTVQIEIWDANTGSKDGAVRISGQPAYDFAQAVMKAQSRVVLRNPNGTVVFDASGSTKAISRLFDHCGLK